MIRGRNNDAGMFEKYVQMPKYNGKIQSLENSFIA
jgi:hypothetical protein